MAGQTTPLAGGVWGVLATPFGDDLRLDTDSLAREVEFFLARRVTGLVTLGVFGEAASLAEEEQEEVLRTVRAAAGADAQLVVGISALETRQVLEQAGRLVAAAGDEVAALMVKANAPEADALAEHLAAVHQAVGAGVVLQDYPVQSGVVVAPAAQIAAVRSSGAVAAVKSESPPTAPAIAELAGTLDVPVFGGLGGVGLLDELAAGSAGAMTGFSHPEGLWAAIEGFASGGFPAAHAAYAPWLPLANFEGQARIGLALRKEILRRRGAIAGAAVRPPAPAAPPALLPLLEQHLAHTPITLAG